MCWSLVSRGPEQTEWISIARILQASLTYRICPQSSTQCVHWVGWELSVSTDDCVVQEFQSVAEDVLKDFGKCWSSVYVGRLKKLNCFDCKGSRSRTEAKRTHSLARSEGRQARKVLWFPHPLVIGLSLSWHCWEGCSLLLKIRSQPDRGRPPG